MLMTAEVKRHGSPKVGTHWLLSDDMQDLLTRMIGIVQATVTESMEEVPPRQHCQGQDQDDLCMYVTPTDWGGVRYVY
jgi:hypothetical protein